MLKKFFYMSLSLIFLASQAYARTPGYNMSGYYGVQEIFPYDGESYDHEFNEEHLDRFPNLRKMVDLASFRVVGERHSVDKDHIYYGDKIMQYADPETFIAFNSSLNNSQYYAKDKSALYVEDRIIVGANPMTFRLVASLLNSGQQYMYGLDDQNLFVRGELVPNVDIASFRLLDTGIAYDKNSVYFLNQVLQDSDPSTFVEVEQGFYKDQSQVYYKGSVVPKINPNTFIIVEGDPWNVTVKDDQYVYYQKYDEWRQIEGADPETFTTIARWYFKDKNYFYSSDGNILLENSGQTIELYQPLQSNNKYLKLNSQCFDYSKKADCSSL